MLLRHDHEPVIEVVTVLVIIWASIGQLQLGDLRAVEVDGDEEVLRVLVDKHVQEVHATRVQVDSELKWKAEPSSLSTT